MSLDSILQASLPIQLVNDKPVGPTLLIGLGGTGKEVLLRLRRKIVEGYGSLSRLPFLRFVHIDTDKNQTAAEQYDLRMSDDPLYQEVKFSTTERIDLTVAGGTGKYVAHLNNFPSIQRWFPAGSKITQLGDLREGAGQVRIASRLGFFDAANHQKITGRLEQCRRELSDAAILAEAARFGFNFNATNMRVVIIASLAGGTGSGTFLDMGFLARRYFPDAERVGILLLPGFFSGYAGAERVRANGYAALMELNHYTFGHTFTADWSGHDGERMLPPPFSSTYLIDGRNEAGLSIGSGGKEYDAYRMVAEVLYQDYSIGSFAGMKRATRVNLEQFNLNVYTHNFLNEALRRRNDATHKAIVGDMFPCRFGSFGLATISFPTDRVQAACASRLASQILDYWQKSIIDDPLEHLFTKFLTDERVQCAQGSYERRDGGGPIERADIEDALAVYDAGGGRTFDNFLWQKAQALRVELEAAPNGEKAALLSQRRSELDQFFAKEDSENADEWGMGVRLLETNMRAYLERVKAGAEAKAAELADNPHCGVNYTLSLLKELKALLRSENFRYMHHFDKRVPQWRDRVQYYAYALDQLHLDIGRHEGEFLFRSADLKRDSEKLVADQDEEDRGIFFSHFQARVGKQIAKRGRLICDELDRFLGADHPGAEGLLGRYYDLLAGFARVKAHLQKKIAYFSKPEKSELTLTLFRDGDVDDWYRTWVGEGAAETETLKVLGNRILSDVFEVEGVTAALEKIQRTPSETVEGLILTKCRDFIAGKPKQPDALTMLFDGNRFSVRERTDMVQQAYRLSKVWAAPSDHGLEHTGLPPVSTDQRPCLIGFEDGANVQKVVEFKHLVENARTPGDTIPSYLNIGVQHRGTIVFYNELAGVPVFYPSSVTAPHGLRAAYNAFPEKEELHTDKNRFQFGDLIPKEAADARKYAESLQAFVLARVLGLLAVHPLPADGDQLAFRFSYQRVTDLIVEDVNLGGEAHAVDFLYRDRNSEHLTHRRYLLQKIEKTIHTLREQKKLAVYRLLLDFYLEKVYPPRKVDNSGIPDLTMMQYSPEYAVLDEARTRLNGISGDEKQFRAQYATLTGKGLEDTLTYQEYRDALAPYCKTAGQYAGWTEDAVVHASLAWHDVFALDLAKIDKNAAREQTAPPPRPATPVVVVEKQFGDRPCPNCAKAVDRRAIFCAHCKKHIATNVACPHCQESHVPDDLELCWKCGLPMREGEPLDCPQCYSWRGYEEQFPCPNCSYDPKAPSAVVTDTPILTVAGPLSDGAASQTATLVAEPVPATTVALVQCPICYSNVMPGARCSICDSPLELR
ncbi:MAG TPA: tubulin-like doman-containing protein [Thermoanaerobaculia bacterium]|nr:tubulin-like doman-containing protein [Thermoanaerobaculia bacterium]